MGKSFFDTLKQYTTIAFCTSKQGATQTLAYDYIPGKYEGCVSACGKPAFVGYKIKCNGKATTTRYLKYYN